MQRVLAAITCIVVGCYADPDYGPTQFRCDATHGCPDGQACVAGTCTGGGPGGDAAQGVGVLCGATVCAGNQQCCADFVNAAHCIGLAEACPGFGATCDGIEDCNGTPCCDSGGGGTIACAAVCQNQICREPSDCTTPGSTQCCFGLGGGNEPWGRCFPTCP